MKHIALSLVIVILAASCVKNKKYCWRCTNITTVTIDSEKPVVTTANNDVCDRTEDDMRNSNSYTADTVKYGDTMTVISVFDNSCTKL